MKFKLAAIAAISILASVSSAQAGWHGGWHGGGWHAGWHSGGWGWHAGWGHRWAPSVGYTYGPYISPYAYGPPCILKPKRVVDQWGQVVIRNVQVCY